MPPARTIRRSRQCDRSGGSSSPISPCSEDVRHVIESTLPTLTERLEVKVEPELYDTTQRLSESYPSSPSSCSPSTPSDGVPSSASLKPTSRKARREDPDYIPRPRNAFIIFRSQYVSTHPNHDNEPQNTLSKAIGAAWHAMSLAQRAPFYEQASREKDLHESMYPNYIFAPQRRAKKGKKPKKAPATSTFSETSSDRSSPASSAYPSLQPSTYTNDEPSAQEESYMQDDFVPTSQIPLIELSPQNNYDFSPQVVNVSPNNVSPFDHQDQHNYLPEQGPFDQFEMSPQVQAQVEPQSQDQVLSPLPLLLFNAGNSGLPPVLSHPLPDSPSVISDPYTISGNVDSSFYFPESPAYEPSSYSYLFDDHSLDLGHDLPLNEQPITDLRLTSLFDDYEHGLGFPVMNDNEAMDMSLLEALADMHFTFQ